MINVLLAAEPHAFDRRVRQKGLRAIREMVGQSHPTRRGRKRAVIANHEAEIPAEKFPPYWRDALDDMLTSYDRICAFLSLYIENATGNPSVDHMLPKAREWNKVYEWNNYRLCAANINGRKGDMVDIIDPFECKEGWFSLELVGYQVICGREAPASLSTKFAATLTLLNAPECCRAREEYVRCYETGEISYVYLRRRAPFVAAELRRQQRLRTGD